jgi:hypothetical protein
MTSLKVNCNVCGINFIITDKDKFRLRAIFGDNYIFPKKCLNCRKLKKERRLSSK